MNHFQTMEMIIAKHQLDRVLWKNAVIGGAVMNNLSSIASHLQIKIDIYFYIVESKLWEAIKNNKLSLLKSEMKFSNKQKYISTGHLKVFLIELIFVNIIYRLVDRYNKRKIRRNACEEKAVENEEIKVDLMKHVALFSLFLIRGVCYCDVN